MPMVTYRSAAAAIGQPSSPGCTLPTCRIPTRQWGADFGSQLPTAVLPERAGSLLVRRDGVGGDRVVAGLLQLVLLDLARLVAELAEHLVVLGHERVAEAGPVAAEPLVGDGERDRDDGAVQLAVALGRVVQDRRDSAGLRLRVGIRVDAEQVAGWGVVVAGQHRGVQERPRDVALNQGAAELALQRDLHRLPAGGRSLVECRDALARRRLTLRLFGPLGGGLLVLRAVRRFPLSHGGRRVLLGSGVGPVPVVRRGCGARGLVAAVRRTSLRRRSEPVALRVQADPLDCGVRSDVRRVARLAEVRFGRVDVGGDGAVTETNAAARPVVGGDRDPAGAEVGQDPVALLLALLLAELLADRGGEVAAVAPDLEGLAQAVGPAHELGQLGAFVDADLAVVDQLEGVLGELADRRVLGHVGLRHAEPGGERRLRPAALAVAVLAAEQVEDRSGQL